jgi:LysM repeat protein
MLAVIRSCAKRLSYHRDLGAATSQEAMQMGNRKLEKVLLVIVLTASLAACARPKPEREVRVPTMKVPSEATATIAVETPTAQAAETEQPTLDQPSATTGPTAVAEASPTPTEPPATPTTQPTPEPTATQTPATFTYRVQTGDTLGAIAERFGTTSRAIAEINDLPNTQIVRVGQLLRIPGEPPEPVDAVGTIEYRVRAGETLSQIALRHRTSTAAILQMNPSIGSPERLRAGALIVIPIGTERPVVAHTVIAGETLTSIAQEYGGSSQSILTLNALSDATAIQTGDVLFIPQ